MTDIAGNFSVNPHNYGKEDLAKPSKVKASQISAKEEGTPKKEIDLDKSPAALSGKAMIKTSSVKGKEGAYKFDPKNVEEDVKTFMLVRGVADELVQDLVEKKGWDYSTAYDAGEVFARCLLANQNV